MTSSKTAPYSYPNSFTHTLKFNSYIDEPEHYSEFCDIILSAAESDVVEIYFNSGGGNGSSMVEIMNIMDQCKAPIHGFLVGSASSAASYLFLHCDVCYVGKHVDMLCHQVSYRTGGSHHEIKASVDHMDKLEWRLVKDTYKHFLSDDEINDLMNGKQIYLDEFEIAERLENRVKAAEAEHQSSIEAQQAEFMAMINEGDYPDWILNKLTKPQLIQLYKGEIYITDIDEANKKFVIKEDDEYLEE